VISGGLTGTETLVEEAIEALDNPSDTKKREMATSGIFGGNLRKEVVHGQKKGSQVALSSTWGVWELWNTL